MIDYTINDDKTIAGGGKGVVLAGRYHILRQLGEGGMGSVWLAEDRQLDNRKVAIKMLPTIVVQDKRAYQQLKSEALVSLKLVHPNIVTLRAFEENSGAPFLVMDYIEGQTLSDYLAAKGKLSEKETVALLKPIAAALDYAHGEKVVHRDVKPSNIIIRKDGHPFILDFGIAREIQESMTRVTGRTISGTLLYMSPEQLRGAPPAPAQDIYSFAAMAYECLKGEPPFTRGEIAYQILNEKPVPLIGESQFVVSIMAGLAKKSENRPKACMDVLMDEIVIRRTEAPSYKFRSTRTTWLAVSVVLVIAVVISLLWGVHAYNKKKNTEQFLALFDAKKYDEAARLIDGIDISNVRVQFSLSEMYLFGYGVLKDEKSAVRWCHKAAAQGDLYAQNGLGVCYECGLGVTKDEKEAAKWYRKAAERGNAQAQYNLGNLYQRGCGVEQNNLKAFNWYCKAADQGHVDAQASLARMYLDGSGIAKDESKAAILFRKSAEQGNVHAQSMLGWMYQHGRGIEKDDREAVKWYRMAAEQGYADAQNNLGDMYLKGSGVTKNEAEAIKWYRKAADQGNTGAQGQLGWLLCLMKDYKNAMLWFNKAAESGDADAQWRLGMMYGGGIGVGKNDKLAAEWFEKAARPIVGAKILFLSKCHHLKL